MEGLTIKEIKSERELDAVMELCYRILGEDDSELVSAVLGREESSESLAIGFVACAEEYRRQGIAREDIFYEQCGYQVIFQVHGQNIYQKLL
ncbi:MAG: hypothetical protein NC543_06520 [bacterium]|nr:hypothetical protein [bacterium]